MDAIKKFFTRDPLSWAVSLVAVLLLGYGLLGGPAGAAPVGTSEAESLRALRPGYVSGHQTVAVTGVTAKTSTLNPQSTYRISCRGDVYYDMGVQASVAATATEAYLPFGAVEYIRTANVGEVDTIAFIRDAADPNTTCYVAEVK